MTRQHRVARFTRQLSALAVSVAVFVTVPQVPGHAEQGFGAPIGPQETQHSWNVEAHMNVAPVADSDRRRDEYGLYNADTAYNGVYDRARLYRVDLASQMWVGSLLPPSLHRITCRSAQSALERSGTWTGALRADGSCSSGEPTDWAVGNFLNFDAGLHETDSEM